MRKNKKRRKTKKIKIKIVTLFILFEFVFTAITGPFLIYYGPFENVTSTVVGSVMTTLSLQWIATLFISDKRIKQIMNAQIATTISQYGPSGQNFGVKVKNKDDNSIERYDIKGKKFKGYVLIVKDPTRIKVGYSSKLGKEGERTSEIAKHNNAIAAINGGSFTDEVNGEKWAGTGAKPLGVIISNGKNMIDNIKDENERINVAALTKSGKLLVGFHSINEMKTVGVTEAVTFGPALIVNGRKTIKDNGGWGVAGRTAIAQRKDGAIILLVIDGRQASSLGATLQEVQDELYDLGAYNAINLDGGSSATMYYQGEVINYPSDSLGERSIPSIIYVEK